MFCFVYFKILILIKNNHAFNFYNKLSSHGLIVIILLSMIIDIELKEHCDREIQYIFAWLLGVTTVTVTVKGKFVTQLEASLHVCNDRVRTNIASLHIQFSHASVP